MDSMQFEPPVISTSEPTFANLNGSGRENNNRPSLHERRSYGSLNNSSKPIMMIDLSYEAILETGRDAAYVDEGSRDRAQFRGWSNNAAGKKVPASCPGTLTIMSYNILATRYVSTDRYPDCPTWVFNPARRSSDILDEVLGCDPDIIAFQEMSLDMYNDDGNGAQLLGSTLRKSHGYDSRHAVVTGKQGEVSHKNPQGDERGEFEGVAIFYRSERFELLEEITLKLNVVAAFDKSLLPQEREKLQVLSHNVAEILMLRDLRVPEGAWYIVATIHAIWDASKPECQIWQLQQVLNKAHELKSTYDSLGTVSVLLLGDLNAEWTNPSLQFALTRSLPPIPHPFTCWTQEPVVHDLVLSDAYAEYCNRHPDKVTAMNPSTNQEGKVIDHVLYEPDVLICTAVGRLGDKAIIPCKRVPSDHYPIAARFVPVWAADSLHRRRAAEAPNGQ